LQQSLDNLSTKV